MSYSQPKTQKEYYQGQTFGDYQFRSLQDVIDQFMVAYVGDDKLISKVDRTDVGFFSQRGLAELSFDTLKSFKTQSIILPPTLVMPLPHDYVNYTRLLWCDDAGIKRPLYRTNDTQNPFQIKQDFSGQYDFSPNYSVIVGTNDNELNDFSDQTITTFKQFWSYTDTIMGAQVQFASGGSSSGYTATWLSYIEAGSDGDGSYGNGVGSLWSGVLTEIADNSLVFRVHQAYGYATKYGFAPAVWQKIDVTNIEILELKAKAITEAATSITSEYAGVSAIPGFGNGTYAAPDTTIRIGLSTKQPDLNASLLEYTPSLTNPEWAIYDIAPSTNTDPNYFDLGYIEWTAGVDNNVEKELVFQSGSFTGDVYLTIIAIVPFTDGPASSWAVEHFRQPRVTSLSLKNKFAADVLEPAKGYYQSSIMWEKYKSHIPNENNNNSYNNEDFQRVADERYGLDPARAQANGSFYIDDRIGRIHFSSNIAGKTVILDYISDSLGTNEEMQVHKFAEEAIYKYIAYNILSVKSNIPEYVVRRLKKEKFAATRQAKLRLSSVKLEEITQVLRGKSKQIKH